MIGRPSKQPSGLAWAPVIPAHWTVKKLAFLASLKSGDSITTDDIKDDGPYPVYGGNGLRGYTDRFTHGGEYALIGRQGALCGNINYAKGEFWASEHAVVVAPREEISVRWLGELLRAMDLNQYSVSAAQPGLSVETIAGLRVPIPPLKEQRAIAAYLDRETARLDALVAAKERVLRLLAEKRRALITRAVTRGLDPRAPLRDSGIPWLGEIPAHWRTLMLRYACTVIQTGSTPSTEFVDDVGATGVHWFTPGDFQETLELRHSVRTVAEAAVEAGQARLFPAGTVFVVGIGATLGKTGFITQPASANQQINALIPARHTHSHFLAYLLTVLGDVMNVSANSATLPILNQQRMGQIVVTLPPLEEQRAIVRFIEEQVLHINEVRKATENTIVLLHERRSALISAAVAGQLAIA